MAISGIDTVAVVVSDRRKALEWYHEVLGLEVAYVGPNESGANSPGQDSAKNLGHWIELGPPRPMSHIHLCELNDHKTDPGPTGITLLTDNIQTDYIRLRELGVRFLYPPKKADWGEWLCEFSDPDGNEFDLKQPLEQEKWLTK